MTSETIMTEIYELEEKELVAKIGGRLVWSDWQRKAEPISFETCEEAQLWVKTEEAACNLRRFKLTKIELMFVRSDVC